MADIERKLSKLTVPFAEQISRENLLKGDKSASEIAREWADLGHPIFAACYLSIADDLNNEDKTNILADAYENKSKNLAMLAEFFIENTGVDQGYLEQARINLSKAASLREKLHQE